jgi:tetratricopeptide (TPR) repeat protein
VRGQLAESRYPDDTSVQWLYLPTLEALAALKRGRPADAVARLEPTEAHDRALPATSFVGFFGSLYSAYVRGEAYRALKQYDRAAAAYRKVIEHRGLVLYDPVDAIARLQLARPRGVEQRRRRPPRV